MIFSPLLLPASSGGTGRKREEGKAAVEHNDRNEEGRKKRREGDETLQPL